MFVESSPHTEASMVTRQLAVQPLRLSASISHVIKQTQRRSRGQLNSAALPRTAASASCINQRKQSSHSLTLLNVAS